MVELYGQLYTLGGWSNFENEPLKTFEVYNSVANKWKQCTPMNVARMNHRVVVLDNTHNILDEIEELEELIEKMSF